MLTRFAIDGFAAARTAPLLVLSMFGAYLAGRRWWPRYAVPGVLAVGAAIAAVQSTLHFEGVAWQWAQPVFTAPAFSFAAVVGIALPLFVVTMASQNLPGIAALRAAGYDAPVSPTVATTGVATLLLAPFGCFSIGIAAISAAICQGPEADEDPRRRWSASAAAGVFYVLTGLLGGAVVALIAAFPKELVLAVAGFALLATIGSALALAMKDERQREAALVTFIVTASGVVLLGIASAFLGVVAGVATLLLRRR